MEFSDYIWDFLIKLRNNHETVRSFGLVAAAIVALPLAIWRSYIASNQAKSVQKQTQINADNHVAETYTKAIDQIGASREAIRLGGLYALEKIAQKNREYHGQIMEVLCSFARLHAPLKTQEEIEEEEIKREIEGIDIAPPTITVQTALTIIGRRETKHDTSPDGETKVRIDLSWTDLRRANLIGANLGGANLTGANFTDAYLRNAVFDDEEILLANWNTARFDRDVMERLKKLSEAE